MISVCKKNMCAGCKACVDICPTKAIKIEDSMEAYNAIINESLCVNCDVCRKVCPQNNEIEMKNPLAWYQGWVKDEYIRATSSSGGVAAALSRTFIEKDGNVCSCIFEDGDFRFEMVDTTDKLHRFAGSKYVKSNPSGIYKQVKDKLAHGEKILFVGLPCQVAAVKKYVGTRYEKSLYTVDLICHGTPSPKLLNLFLKDYKYSLNAIGNILFRKKTTFHIYQEYEGIVPEYIQDTYTYAFLNCLDYTENCYSCKYAKVKRTSDITIGDSWGSELTSDEQGKGISLILCQTEKGKELVKTANLHLENVDLEKAVEANLQLIHPSKPPVQRKKFFQMIKRGYGFNKSIAKCYPQMYYKQKLKDILAKMKTEHTFRMG